jgi:hypothetical protein
LHIPYRVFSGGLIFTRDEAYTILEVDPAVREKGRLEVEQKNKVN